MLEKKPLYPRTSKPGYHCQIIWPGQLYSISARLVTLREQLTHQGFYREEMLLIPEEQEWNELWVLPKVPMTYLLFQPLLTEQRLGTPGRAPPSSPCSAAPTGLQSLGYPQNGNEVSKSCAGGFLSFLLDVFSVFPALRDLWGLTSQRKVWRSTLPPEDTRPLQNKPSVRRVVINTKCWIIDNISGSSERETEVRVNFVDSP